MAAIEMNETRLVRLTMDVSLWTLLDRYVEVVGNRLNELGYDRRGIGGNKIIASILMLALIEHMEEIHGQHEALLRKRHGRLVESLIGSNQTNGAEATKISDSGRAGRGDTRDTSKREGSVRDNPRIKNRADVSRQLRRTRQISNRSKGSSSGSNEQTTNANTGRTFDIGQISPGFFEAATKDELKALADTLYEQSRTLLSTFGT